MSAKVIFTGFRISGEPKYSNASEKERVDFSICSATKYYNGQFLKVYCVAFDEEAAKIRRLKVKRGSLVDIMAEMIHYEKQGKEGISYRILNLSYSEMCVPDSKEKATAPATQKQEEKQEDALRKAARVLSENPFA